MYWCTIVLPLWFWGACTCYWCHCARATCSAGEDSAVSESNGSLPYTTHSQTEGPPSDTVHSSLVVRHTCTGALEIQGGQRSSQVEDPWDIDQNGVICSNGLKYWKNYSVESIFPIFLLPLSSKDNCSSSLLPGTVILCLISMATRHGIFNCY